MASHITSVGKGREQGIHACSAQLPPFYSVQGPVHEVVPPTFRMGLPTSNNPIKKVSQVCLQANLIHTVPH